jgi:hypothetical protein
MISSHIKEILTGLQAHKEDDIYGDDKGPLIDVNKLTGQVSTFYEKLRYVVDYKEEHTIRRSAIERVLKRKLLIERVSNVGLSVLEELVSSGYLSNKSIPENIADNISQIINKYLTLGTITGVGMNRIISLMASEVERFLYPQILDDLIVESFHKNVIKNIKYQGDLNEEDLSSQIYLACRRSLLEDDTEASFYALLIRHTPELPTLNSEEEIKNIAPRFLQVVSRVPNELENPLGWSMASRLKNYSIYFSVIKKILKKYGAMSEPILSDKIRLKEEIEGMMHGEYTKQYDIISKSGVRAVIYILLTKVILAFALELPYEKFFLNEINYFALGTNVIFHPLLLLVIVKGVPPIYSNNTSNIVLGVEEIVEGRNIRPIYIKRPVKNLFLQTIFDFIYLALFVISFGFILWILNKLHFNIVSIVLFLFFLTLVSYFGFRIHHNAKKWRLETENENFLSLLWIFFTVPIVRTGRWLSRKFSKVNIFVFFMDFILETPFKLILGTFNSFISFLKNQREDPY